MLFQKKMKESMRVRGRGIVMQREAEMGENMAPARQNS